MPARLLALLAGRNRVPEPTGWLGITTEHKDTDRAPSCGQNASEFVMATCRPATALAVLAFAASSMLTRQGDAQDVRCQRNELVRQIDVQFAQDGDGLPCQVVWQNSAGSDETKLVWRSDAQLDFCTEKARRLVHQLIDRGWTCDAQVAASQDRSAPALRVRLEPTDAEADAALGLRPEPGPREQAAPPTKTRQEEVGQPDRAVLQAALERDVERLDQLARRFPGRFELKTARLGDLNGDGTEDAVALLTHRPDGAPPSHHLLAYFFDGQTFQPVARIALMETHGELAEAELQDIVDGVIELVLHVAQPGDAACCPSGRRRASFVLREQQLVAVGKHRPGA
jgi:hypothetical protein